MPLSKEAIEYINELAISAGEAIERTDHPAIVLPKQMSVVDLEPYMAERNYYRGEYSTTSIADFLAYVERQQTGTIFVDADKGFAQAFFDLGTKEHPGHAQHQAILQLTRTGDYDALADIKNKRQSQIELAEYLEDYQATIADISKAGQEIPLANAVNAIRSFKIEQTGAKEYNTEPLSARKSSFEQIDMSKNEYLPTHLTIRVAPYEECDEYDFHLRITPVLSGKEPEFKISSIRLYQTRQQFNDDFYKRIQVAEFNTHKGRFNPM